MPKREDANTRTSDGTVDWPMTMKWGFDKRLRDGCGGSKSHGESGRISVGGNRPRCASQGQKAREQYHGATRREEKPRKKGIG